MSGRRRAPEPAIPVSGGRDTMVPPSATPAPPQEHVLYSTDPGEAPQAPEPPPGYAPAGGKPFYDDKEEPFFRDEALKTEEVDGEELSPEEELMFVSLLTCGRRTKSVTILDHTVVVQTLNGDDDLRIGLYVKPFVGSLGEQRAYQIAVAAAGIRTYDGKSFVTTLYTDADQDALFQEKVDKVSKMYPHVIVRIYRAVMDAEKEFVELVTRLGKSDG